MTPTEMHAWLTRFMNKAHYPQSAQDTFLALLRQIHAAPDDATALDALLAPLLCCPIPDADSLPARVRPLADRAGCPAETLTMLLLMLSMRNVREQWLQQGWSEETFWDSMGDFRSKLLECKECRNVWGTFVPGWLAGWSQGNRITLGRFCYITEALSDSLILPDGRTLPAGSLRLACHIPSAGASLTDEVRLDSYRRAYAHFLPQLTDGLLVISCSSWLLYPPHRDFLPPHSNILRFMDDFSPLTQSDSTEHRDMWRIFGQHWGKSFPELPCDTSLRRAYRQRLMDTGLTGRGYGLLIFDGNNIMDNARRIQS